MTARRRTARPWARVWPFPAGVGAQHGHHGSDADTAGQEQQARGRWAGQHEIPLDGTEAQRFPQRFPGPDPVGEVRGHPPVRDRPHGDCETPGAVRWGRDRRRGPLPPARTAPPRDAPTSRAPPAPRASSRPPSPPGPPPPGPPATWPTTGDRRPPESRQAVTAWSAPGALPHGPRQSPQYTGHSAFLFPVTLLAVRLPTLTQP